MNNKVNLKTFVDQIFSINPRYASIYGSKTPGMASASAAGVGASSSASDIIDNLHRETAQFAESVNSGQSDDKALAAHAEKIEGYLFSLQTLDQISDKFCDELLDNLNSITEK